MNTNLTYIVAGLFLVLMMAGCTTTPVAPIDNPATIVHLNLAPQPPLDLSKYKAIQRAVIDSNGATYSCVAEDQIELEQELLVVLQNRIEADASVIQAYKNFYEPATK